MPPTRSQRMRPALPITLCLAGALAAQTPAVPPAERPRPPDAAALFATMARMTGLEASFAEAKHVALLALPLQSKGRLFYLRRDPATPDAQPQGYLCRITDAPEPSRVTITPTELRLQNRDGTEVVDLSRSDKVRTFITSLVHVFAGDAVALTKSYQVRYELPADDAAAWTLTLVPRVEPLDKMLKHLRLVGRGESVQRIEIEEPNGDRTVTEILTADPARRFDRDEQKQLFGIEAP